MYIGDNREAFVTITLRRSDIIQQKIRQISLSTSRAGKMIGFAAIRCVSERTREEDEKRNDKERYREINRS